MLQKILRRYGIVITTLGVTIVSILCSLLIYACASYLMGRDMGLPGLIISTVSPAIVTSLLGGITFRILFQLDDTEQRLRILSNTDELTQTYNRRFFIEFCEQELARAIQTGEGFSLAILDLDKFKDINDNHGHLFGDRVLYELACLFKKQIRSTDILARYGGDEFIFFFKDAGRNEARSRAECIFETFKNHTLQVEGVELKVLFSTGVASFGPGINTLDDILRQADQALYLAKHKGGGCYVLT